MPTIRNIPFNIAKKDVLQGLGMGARPNVRPEIDQLIDEVLKNSTIISLIQPALVYKIIYINSIQGDECILQNGIVFKGETIPRVFPNAKALVVAVATIGPQLEDKVTELFKQGQRLKGLIVDAIGSSATENIRFAMRDVLDKEAKKLGFTLSSPVSPGGTRWPITEQFKLFKLVHAESIGVRLTETAMMVPRKSSSMVMGLGENMPTWSATERCDMCPRGADCPYRFQPDRQCENVNTNESVSR